MVETDSVEESSSSLSTLVETNRDVIEERRAKLAKYKENFDAALALYEREMDNDNFVSNFDALVTPFLKEVEGCEEALQARTQQSTWRSKNRKNKKLALWLR